MWLGIILLLLILRTFQFRASAPKVTLWGRFNFMTESLPITDLDRQTAHLQLKLLQQLRGETILAFASIEAEMGRLLSIYFAPKVDGRLGIFRDLFIDKMMGERLRTAWVEILKADFPDLWKEKYSAVFNGDLRRAQSFRNIVAHGEFVYAPFIAVTGNDAVLLRKNDGSHVLLTQEIVDDHTCDCNMVFTVLMEIRLLLTGRLR